MNPSTIVKPCQQKVFQQDNIYCQYDETAIENFSPKLLDVDYWQQNNSIVGTAQGRGTTYFVEQEQQQWVLRHYYRGGLMGRIIHDSYLFTGWQNTRAAKEFLLLKQLEILQLPAPKAIAYRVMKSGISYRADLLTSRIEQARDLVAMLSQGEIDPSLWSTIGQHIQLFHQHGIYHHDLNAHNILIDNHNKVWIIDFDRSEQRTPSKTWQQANMDRLLRSFNKEKAKLDKFHWHMDNWQRLMEGYLGA